MTPTFPPIDAFKPTNIGQLRELEVIQKLATTLPDGYAIFHSVMWSSVHEKRQCFGEIDAIVLAPSGNVVLLEVKAGPVEFSDKGITKRYDGKDKNILGQLRVQYASFRQRMKEEAINTFVAQLLVVPDIAVATGSVAYPRERIVDSYNFTCLADKVIAAVPHGEDNAIRFLQVKRFLLNLFALSIDPTARLGWLGKQVTQLADGLATWVPRIKASSSCFLVTATAGSGKSQLAVRLLETANQKSVAYVCFNRPLADHLRAVLPEKSAAISTFHELAISHAKANGLSLDLGDPRAFELAGTTFVEHCEAHGGDKLDILIIDEAQDFSATWLLALRRLLKPDGHLYILEDEDQRLYQREGMPLQEIFLDAVQIASQENFRSPRQIVETINALQLTTAAVEPRCPIAGEQPGFHVWASDDPDGINELKRVIDELLHSGFKHEQLCLLSFRGRGRSRLLQQDRLGDMALKLFTGKFDASGQAVWSEGNLLADTLFRFKGQAAPVVILCEVDFEELDDETCRRLFVGMSRAQLQLEIVLSERAAQRLGERLI